MDSSLSRVFRLLLRVLVGCLWALPSILIEIAVGFVFLPILRLDAKILEWLDVPADIRAHNERKAASRAKSSDN